LKVAIFFLALAACQAVPDVSYEGTLDGGNTCPDQVPPYATMCCGPIPCFGDSCVASCDDCVARCTLDTLCCPNAQFRATCKPSLACQ
jgi:hypothetical protein